MVLGKIAYFSITALLWAMYAFVQNRIAYWQKRGIPFSVASFPFGLLKGLGKVFHISDVMNNVYYETRMKAPYGGFHFNLKPIAMATDLDFIEQILKSDNKKKYFIERAFYYDQFDEPITRCFNIQLDDEKRENFFNNIIQFYSDESLKFIFPTVSKVSNQLQKLLDTELTCYNRDEIEIKQLSRRYAMDSIMTCYFGTYSSNLLQQECLVKVLFETIHEERPQNIFSLSLFNTFPKLSCKLRATKLAKDIANFYQGIVEETAAYREKMDVHENDFLELMIKLKNETKNFNRDEMIMHSFMAISSGLEKLSIPLIYCLYEIARNSTIQEKCRTEILNSLKKNNGKLIYEELSNLQYVERVLNEVLRKYPPNIYIERECIEDYKLSNSFRVFEKGLSVVIPVQAIQNDDEINRNSNVFDPDRFSPEAMKKRPTTLVTFNDGPKDYTGMKYSRLAISTALVDLLSKFRFTIDPRTEVPLKLDLNSFALLPRGDVILKFEKL